jgi:pimeloyl-ACP methyl ester carboxylesterase
MTTIAAPPPDFTIDLPELTVAGFEWRPDRAGAEDPPLAILLHGYPDTAWGYRHLGPRLAAAGWRAVAPYLRGYAPTPIPVDRDFHVGALAADAIALADALSPDRPVALIGHDWGAIATNCAAAAAPERWSHTVALAVPPIPVIRSILGTPADAWRERRMVLRQMRNSWYAMFQQLPLLPEAVMPRAITKLWRDWSPGYADPSADVAAFLAAMPNRDHWRASLGYYRAFSRPWLRNHHRELDKFTIEMPSRPLLYIQGLEDGCLTADLVRDAESMLPAGSVVVRHPKVGHFLHLEDPDAIGDLVADYLTSAG